MHPSGVTHIKPRQDHRSTFPPCACVCQVHIRNPCIIPSGNYSLPRQASTCLLCDFGTVAVREIRTATWRVRRWPFWPLQPPQRCKLFMLVSKTLPIASWPPHTLALTLNRVFAEVPFSGTCAAPPPLINANVVTDGAWSCAAFQVQTSNDKIMIFDVPEADSGARLQVSVLLAPRRSPAAPADFSALPPRLAVVRMEQGSRRP